MLAVRTLTSSLLQGFYLDLMNNETAMRGKSGVPRYRNQDSFHILRVVDDIVL